VNALNFTTLKEELYETQAASLFIIGTPQPESLPTLRYICA